jgi:hypothetical protein
MSRRGLWWSSIRDCEIPKDIASQLFLAIYFSRLRRSGQEVSPLLGVHSEEALASNASSPIHHHRSLHQVGVDFMD